MKITKVVSTPVHVPMDAPLRWSMGVETGTTRTIVEVHTDEGIVDLGETYGGDSTCARVKDAERYYELAAQYRQGSGQRFRRGLNKGDQCPSLSFLFHLCGTTRKGNLVPNLVANLVESILTELTIVNRTEDRTGSSIFHLASQS